MVLLHRSLATAAALLCPLVPAAAAAAPQEDVGFERRHLETRFYAEGAGFGDLDRDGHQDVIYGPFWFRGPAFEERHDFYAGDPFDPLVYSDNFFCYTQDFDADGWLDVLVIGFPGKHAFWYQNPGEPAGKGAGDWTKHLALPNVDNEAAAFVDLTGDGLREIVCSTRGRFGYAAPDPDRPTEVWQFEPITPDVGAVMFNHGLGVGDVNGDGRPDLLERTGWWEQPAESGEGWKHHAFDFGVGRRGGAQMFALDVDGDGDADVVTSLDGHGYGLSWFEQLEPGADPAFREHRIMDATPEKSAGGLVVTQLHALDLADFDGDGLMDVVTGKRYWAHGPKGDPGSDVPPQLVWYQLVRDADGARFVPRVIDSDSGVGTQVTAGDVNGDGRPDVIVGNKKGAFCFLQRDAAAAPVFDALEELNRLRGEPARAEDGRALNFDFETGDLTDWRFEGEAFVGQPVRGDTVSARGREASRHQGEYWLGGYEHVGDGPTGRLRSRDFEVLQPYASFLMGGGKHDETRVEIVDARSGETIYRTSGVDYETLQRAVVDLSAHVGRTVFLLIVDEHSGGWGHVNFDDFRFHAERPEFPVDPSLPLFRPKDQVAYAGLTPEAAAEAMTVPAGFEVELVCGEPDVRQPIALTIDHAGRLWVAEAYSYPVRVDDDEARDRILVFEDTTGDGRFNKRTVFQDGLNLVSGLEVGLGGVWVGAAPYLMFIPDANDDLVPDGEPRILLDGWRWQDTHETLNAFTFGPDGWLYGCHGVFTHSLVGKPGTPDDEREPVNAAVWRYHPETEAFETFAWGSSNPWGVDFDENGQAFITACVIPHLFHVVQGARYHRQAGEHFDPHVYEDIRTIADHRHYLGDNPHRGNHVSGAAGGGHAHCGAMIYLGDSFPEEWRGSIFMNNVHGNRVNTDRFERAGSSFVGTHGPDFLLANDEWFRGINLKYGPSGSVYLIDWYDQQACHENTPEKWDRGNGRIYRVSYGGHTMRFPHLPSAGGAELVQMQRHANAWYSRRARLELQRRGPDPAVHAALREMLADADSEPLVLRALWTLHVTDGLDEALALEQLSSPHEYVRAWTVQLACEDRAPSSAVREALVRMASQDPSPVVRLYLASAAQRLAPDTAWPLVEGLTDHGEDEEDANLPFLYWYALEPLVTDDLPRALALAARTPLEKIARFVVRRAAYEDEHHSVLCETIARADETRRDWWIEELSSALDERRKLELPAAWPALYAQLADAPDSETRDRALWLAANFGDRAVLPRLRTILADSREEPARRERALEAVERLRDPLSVPLLGRVLHEPSLRGPALRALSAFDDPVAPGLVLAVYDELDAAERRDALNTLSSRPRAAQALLGAVGSGVVQRKDLSAFVLRKLRNLRDEEVDALLNEHYGTVRETPADKRAEIARLRDELSPAALSHADLPNGRDVFVRTCEQCHTLYGTGGDLGPDLTGSNRRDLDYLLENLVDPSSVVGKDYQTTMIWTTDGLLVTGIVRRDGVDTVTLATENDVVVLAKDEIEERVLSDNSTMPEGQLALLTDEERRDLVAYLMSETQVPRRATPDNTGDLFNGEDLTNWTGNPDVWSVESGEIVGKSDGLAHNEFLKSHLELGDFHLKLEVLLVDDAGNSGIQFRSRALDGGDVEGYQADIGVGWWGDLYEEHGRALLVDTGESTRYHPGEWNTYEIEAVGHHIRTWINGNPCVDLEDPDGALRGILALQVHSGGPTEVRFRNLQLQLR